VVRGRRLRVRALCGHIQLGRSELDAAIKQAGVRAFTAAFVSGSGCNPTWGDRQGLDESVATDAMARAEREGAQTIVSFGGEAGAELGQSCTDLGALTAAYQRVIDKYRTDHVASWSAADAGGAGVVPSQTVDAVPGHDGAPSWRPGVGYATGQQVTLAVRTYVCLQGHTSQVNWTPPDTPALWRVVANPADNSWQPGVGYATGQLVTYGGRTYRCLQDHTPQANWTPPTTLAFWQPTS
jgi:hypothetical protein